MSEFINNKTIRVESLLEFSLGIFRKEKGKELLDKHQEAIDNLSPFDVIELVDKLVRMGISTEEIKKGIAKVLNLFYTPLLNFIWEKPTEETFISHLMLENRAMEHIMKSIKMHLKLWNKAEENSEEANIHKEFIHQSIIKLQDFEQHYVKKENILFPYLEREWTDYRCLQIMWAIHDDIRKSSKRLLTLFSAEAATLKEFNKELGIFFFAVYAIKFREEFILFPVIQETISTELLDEMYEQSFEEGFPLIETPKKQEKNKQKTTKNKAKEYIELGNALLKFETGEMSLKITELIINTLPVDMTVVDENDKVVFFSNPSHRIFPRSKAIIGRSVQNCHPPDSVHVVNDIVESFRKGEKDSERFWIQMRGMFILIEYFALRDENGNFKGTIEVSQDISEYRALKGEKRLANY